MVQLRKRFVSGHRFSDAAKRDNCERHNSLLKNTTRAASAAKAGLILWHLRRGLKPRPFKAKPKTVKALGLARHGTAAKACALYLLWRHA